MPTSFSTTSSSPTRCSTACGATPSAFRRQAQGRARHRTGRDQPASDRRRESRPQCRSLEGRRSLRLRTRRRGARSACAKRIFRSSIVPGITAALGCAAEAGLPLTFRKEATRLSFVTANRADEADAVDWSGLAGKDTTVVVYMGLASAAAVRNGLIEAGRDPRTPVAVLARGTRPDSRAATGRLDDLPALAAAAGEGPALLVIGEVVAHSKPWREAARIPGGTGGRMTAPHEQKKRKVNGPVVVTANRLGDGAVVYRTVTTTGRPTRAAAVVDGAGSGGAAATRGSRRRACGRPLCRAGRAGDGQPRAAGQSARAHPARRPDLRAAGRPMIRQAGAGYQKRSCTGRNR